jgi:hypothetical protein
MAFRSTLRSRVYDPSAERGWSETHCRASCGRWRNESWKLR